MKAYKVHWRKINWNAYYGKSIVGSEVEDSGDVYGMTPEIALSKIPYPEILNYEYEKPVVKEIEIFEE